KSIRKELRVVDRELLAMKLTFEERRHWLEGVRHPFTVITDHKNLEYLQPTKASPLVALLFKSPYHMGTHLSGNGPSGVYALGTITKTLTTGGLP
ncbi:hypothetical protein P4O66_005614, partial [Electrophorus voltai]